MRYIELVPIQKVEYITAIQTSMTTKSEAPQTINHNGNNFHKSVLLLPTEFLARGASRYGMMA